MQPPSEQNPSGPAAQDTEASLSFILDSARIGTWQADLDSDSICLSRLAAEFFGCSGAGPLPHASLLERVAPEDRERVAAALRGSGDEEGFREQFSCAAASGSARWLEMRGRFMPGISGSAGHSAGIVCDITAQKRSEELAEARNRLLPEILESLPIGVWLLDRNGKIVHGNPAVEQLWAGARYVAPDEFGQYIGWWADSGKRIEPHEWAAARAIERGESSVGEIVDIQNFRGERKTIINSAIPLRNDRGEVTGAVVTNEDITEQRRIEEALRDSEERFRSIFNQSAVSISLIGLDGRFLLANPVTCQLLGYDSAEMIGLPMADVVHPEDFPLTSDSFDRMLRGEQTSYHVVRRYVRKDGSFLWGRATTSVVCSGSGAPRYFLTVAEDVTEAMRAEEAERAHAERMSLLAEIAAELLASSDSGRQIEWLCERVADHIGAGIYLHHAVSDDRNRLDLRSCRGLTPPERAALASIDADPDNLAESIQCGADIATCSTFPIVCQGETTGALTFGMRDQGEFPAGTPDFLRTISHYVGLAAERIRLSERLTERIEQYGELIAAQREMAHAEPDLAVRMQLLAARAQEIAHSAGAGITRIEDDFVEYIAGSGTVEAAVGERIPMFGSLIGLAVRENRPMRSDDSETDDRVHKESCRHYNVRSMIAVPLQYNSTTVGALTVVADRPGAFNDDHMAVAEVMSSIVVAAMSAVAEAETREALSAAEELLRLALEGARIGIWSWDIVADTVYCSPETYRLLGHAQDVPMTVWRSLEHVHPDEREAAVRKMRQILDEESAYEMELRFLHPDGSTRWITARGRVIRAPGGAAIRLDGVVMDATERKRLQEQLLQAQKMEGIGRLAGGVAHDFNNLLSVILGYTELVQMDLTEESPLWSSLKNIQSAAMRAATLTKQLLAFARRQAADPKVIDLNDLIRSMAEMLKPLVGEHIEMRLDTEASPALVKIDPNQMEQVIVNLAVNSRDAMPDGGSLLIATRRIALEGGRMQEDVGVIPGEYVCLSVSDTGHGIPPGVLERIFEPFFTTKERGKGTGLGLATCYGIVRQNEGYIWPYSEPGIGTTLKVFLPAASEAPRPALARAAPPTSTRGSATVLVAEDEDLVRELVVGALRNSGYTVLEAHDGKSGLAVAEQYPGAIDLLLSDLVMPNMGGEELAQELRQRRPDMRVAFVSGYSEDIATLKGLLPADTPLFQKPIAPSELLAQIAALLGKPADA